VIVMSDSLFVSERLHIVELAAAAARPVIYPRRSYVEAGGLIKGRTRATCSSNRRRATSSSSTARPPRTWACNCRPLS